MQLRYVPRALYHYSNAFLRRKPTRKKRHKELAFWLRKATVEGHLDNDHFEYYYTSHFDLEPDDYEGKRILDIGCGPRGSLEWADSAEERIGIDPLADDYQHLGAENHSMTYVAGRAEDLEFDDGYFDIVTSMNSLDHVDDLDTVIQEIKRVTKPGGIFLVITDVNHQPTIAEPISYDWDITERFEPEFELLWEDHREKSEGGVYESAKAGEPYDHENPEQRYGVLSAKFRRREVD